MAYKLPVPKDDRWAVAHATVGVLGGLGYEKIEGKFSK